MSVEIEKLTININGEKHELTIDIARELHRALGEVLREENRIFYPVYPVLPTIWQPIHIGDYPSPHRGWEYGERWYITTSDHTTDIQ